MWHCWTKKYMLALNSHVSQLQHSTECVLSCSIMSNSLWPHGLYPTRLLFPWGFCKQEYWSGLPCPPPGDLFKPGSEPRSPAVQADSLPSEPPVKSLELRVTSKYGNWQQNAPISGIHQSGWHTKILVLSLKSPLQGATFSNNRKSSKFPY